MYQTKKKKPMTSRDYKNEGTSRDRRVSVKKKFRRKNEEKKKRIILGRQGAKIVPDK